MIVGTVIPDIFSNLKDENVIIRDLSNSSLMPLAEIYLDCPIVKGNVKVAVRKDDLPLEGVNFLLGNDLAGEAVLPNLVICNVPVNSDLTEMNENEGKGNEVAVVTRAQGKKSQVTEVQENFELKHFSDFAMNRSDLVLSQRADETLKEIRESAVNIHEISKAPCYYFDNDLLFRLYRPIKLTEKDTWSERRQLVVPTNLRERVLELAHNNVVGHFGIHKTYERIANYFFWPKLKSSVKSFVSTCLVCQKTGKPNEIIPKAPLIPICVPKEPFEKIIIDCVGPLPKTKKGHEYMLTILCPTTRFPIAIPIRNITAKTIVQNLLKVFTNYGIPKVLQCDRGTNFTSNLFTNALKDFGISHCLSSPYHPESQGALERHHQTLKALLKKFCLETGSDWDENLDFLMLAIREVPHDSLGVSPFEMLYGRRVRGFLKVFRDKLIDDSVSDNVATVSQYLSKLKENLERVHSFAESNLKESQVKMKESFDRKSKVRKFKVGDSVLVYFPVSTNAIQSKFNGPYNIIKCLNNNNYVISTPDRRKSSQIVHVNLIKKYHTRPTLLCSEDKIVKLKYKDSSDKESSEEIEECIISWKDSNNSEILEKLDVYLNHLIPSHILQMKILLQDFADICKDVPQRCAVIQHDIELLPNTNPIRQNYYRVSEDKRRIMKEEVSYLLKNKLAIPSTSPWSSPCLLVPKENGKMRLCTDFRKVNSVTVKDSYPLPRVEDILDQIGKAKYLTKIDLLRGYYQIGLTEKAQQISAFVTPFGLFQYKVMPFGLTNAAATFQRVVNEVIRDLEGTFAYIDDIVVVADDWSQLLERLTGLFRKLRNAGLTINLAKSKFASGKVTYLGYEIGNGLVKPKESNTIAILNFPKPTNRKLVMRFLGMASYYRKFCKNFAAVAAPLTNLTSSKCTFDWTEKCDKAFNQIKLFLATKPVLMSPDLSAPFLLQVDACDVGAGSVLMQMADDKMFHPVAYMSSKFKKHQRNYSTIEKELLGIILAVQKFEVYFMSHNPVRIMTDHDPLRFLQQAKFTNQRLLRWSLYLQQFNITIESVKGSQNTVADALSRVQ